jgi:hypothetical protein
VSKWAKQYGREDILPKRVKVETMSETVELREARKRIRELEAAQDVSAHGLLPNQAWAADITYIRTDEGFLYLSVGKGG